jgi:phage gp36-like protein
MPYVSLIQIQTKIPAAILNDALDDDGDGKADAGQFDAIVATASAEIDGYLSGLFAVPFADPAPAKVVSAAMAFVCEMIYQRRGVQEERNPFDSVAKFWRKHLQQVGNREIPFDASAVQAFVPGAAITDPVSLNAQST